MKLIPRIKEGETYPSPWSAEYFNLIVDTCNMVRSARGVGGIKIEKAESGLVFYGSGSIGSTNNSGSSPSSGSIVTYERSDTWQ